MKKFVPYEKMSKKEKRRIDLLKRRDWGSINPATKIDDSDNIKRYKRRSKYPPDYL